MDSPEKVLGIDFGTTNSAIAVMKNGSPKIIRNSEGERTTPSVVAFTDDGEQLVGKQAKNQAVKNPKHTIESIKQHIGREDFTIEANGHEYTPEEIVAMILEKLKADAEDHLSHEVTKALITVPGSFNNRQRHAIKHAGKIAGLEVERIIHETAASSIVYGSGDRSDQTILVYDLGGGSFSVSVIEIGGGVYDEVAVSSHDSLGGNDWDQAIINHLSEDFEEEHGIDLYEDSQARQRLSEAAEEAKIELSSQKQTKIQLPFVAATNNNTLDLKQTLTRDSFESRTENLLDETVKVTEQTLKDTYWHMDDIDNVLLVGSSTRMPQVSKRVAELTDKKPKKNLNPEESVALGAAIYGGVLSGDVDDTILLDVTPLSLGIEVTGGFCEQIVEKNTTVPTVISKVFTTPEDKQFSLQFRVFEGENDIAAENELLGEFTFNNIVKAQAGDPKIEIEFTVDEHNLASVKARNMKTGRSETLTLDDAPNSSSHDTTYPEERPSVPTLYHTTDERLESIIFEGPVTFENERALIDTLGEQTAEFDDSEEVIEILCREAVDIENEEQLVERWTKEPVDLADKTDLIEIVESFIKRPFEFENGKEVLEMLVEGTVDVWNNLHYGYQHCPQNSQSTADIKEAVRLTRSRIQETLGEFPDEYDGRTVTALGAIPRLYRALDAVDQSLQEKEMTAVEWQSAIDRLNKALSVTEYAVIAPKRGSEPDLNRHEISSEAQSDLPEGRIIEVEEVGYEQDGDVVREAKIIVSKGRVPIPETIPTVPRLDLSYDRIEKKEQVASGATANVYLATTMAGDDTIEIALKEPWIGGTRARQVVERLMDEADIWQRLDNHDHIVSIVNYGTKPQPWISMEYMDAGHLGERAGKLDLDQAVWTAIAITHAVRHAHRRGIAHQDLKPENVLFQSVEKAWDVPKVADWGLAKHLLEHPKSTKGLSPQYAAPEQFDEDRGPVDDITDIYQLGAMFYELVTGQPPFRGRGDSIRNKVLTKEPTPPSEVTDVARELDDILLKALAKDRFDRYETVVNLRNDLQNLFERL